MKCKFPGPTPDLMNHKLKVGGAQTSVLTSFAADSDKARVRTSALNKIPPNKMHVQSRLLP